MYGDIEPPNELDRDEIKTMTGAECVQKFTEGMPYDQMREIDEQVSSLAKRKELLQQYFKAAMTRYCIKN